jgi:hypothetical protein
MLVESCFKLVPKLIKKDLLKARDLEPIEGFLNFTHNDKETALDYSFELDGENTRLIIMFGAEPQYIQLSEQQLSIGSRTVFVCACGRKTYGLYLLNDTFACLKCQKLHYASTRINRRSKHGEFLHKQLQVIKLIEMRESISRPFYKSNYTRRYQRWLKLCLHAGIYDEVIRGIEFKKAMEQVAQ